MLYLAKFILCSGLLFTAYILLFDKEKALQFKRFYLLFSLLLSLTIPLITFESSAPIILKGTESYLNIYTEVPVTLTSIEINQPQETSIYPNLILAIYIGISLVFLLRFTLNFYKILGQTKSKTKTTYKGITVILNDKISTPYSFLNYIFVNKTEFEHNQIAEEILLHELTHVRQKHSLDVIFIELLQVFLWFNPMLYFYRKAIQTNHEYLADENVIQTSQDIPTYQMLLLNHISRQCGLTLTSQFDYLTIKKRLTMMSKTNAAKAVLGKQLLLIPVLGIALFLFSTKTEAQVTAKKLADSQSQKTVFTVKDFKNYGPTKDGLNEAEQLEYKSLVDKYFSWTSKQKQLKIPRLATNDLTRCETLYRKMNKEQQRTANIVFSPPMPLLEKISPSLTQLSSWGNSKRFGVWVDGKRIENANLSNYKTSDFSRYTVGTLTKLALNYGKLDNEIYLWTNSRYHIYYEDAVNNPKSRMMFRQGDFLGEK